MPDRLADPDHQHDDHDPDHQHGDHDRHDHDHDDDHDHDHDDDHDRAPDDVDDSDAFDRVTFSDDELSELALAADPFDPFADDVVPFEDDPAGLAVSLLPDWYMPPPSLRAGRRRPLTFAAVAVALFTINIGGLCVTYGIPDPVWK